MINVDHLPIRVKHLSFTREGLTDHDNQIRQATLEEVKRELESADWLLPDGHFENEGFEPDPELCLLCAWQAYWQEKGVK